MLVLAPRHTDRFGEVEAVVSGFQYRKASELLVAQENFVDSGCVEIVLLDTIGDLAAVYGIADAAFVGGSLGGERVDIIPWEPAQFGVPVVMGESYENFRDVVGDMRAAEGIRIVRDKDELEQVLEAMFGSGRSVPQRLKPQPEHDSYGTAEAVPLSKTAASEDWTMGERGRAVFEAQSGATARTVRALMELLPGRLP